MPDIGVPRFVLQQNFGRPYYLDLACYMMALHSQRCDSFMLRLRELPWQNRLRVVCDLKVRSLVRLILCPEH